MELKYTVDPKPLFVNIYLFENCFLLVLLAGDGGCMNEYLLI